MQKWLYRLILALYAVTAVCTVLRGGPKAILGPVSLLFLLVPPVMEWLFRRPLGLPMRCATLFFCLLGFHLGTALDWYHRFLGFDKFVHTLSGVFFCVIGFCLYAVMQKEPVSRGTKPLLEFSYAFFFVMAVAAIWEIFEYVGFLLTGHDAQNVATTGIHDTMQDMLACLAGSAIAGIDYLVFLRRGSSPLMALTRSFDTAPPRPTGTSR